MSYTPALWAPNLALTFRAVNLQWENVNFTLHTVSEIKSMERAKERNTILGIKIEWKNFPRFLTKKTAL